MLTLISLTYSNYVHPPAKLVPRLKHVLGLELEHHIAFRRQGTTEQFWTLKPHQEVSLHLKFLGKPNLPARFEFLLYFPIDMNVLLTMWKAFLLSNFLALRKRSRNWSLSGTDKLGSSRERKNFIQRNKCYLFPLLLTIRRKASSSRL